MHSIKQRVKTRIMAQLITSLIYEKIVVYTMTHLKGNMHHVEIKGEHASYHFDVRVTESFDRLQLTSQIMKVSADGSESLTLNYAQLLRDVQYTFTKDTQKIEQFIGELIQTELKDCQALTYKLNHYKAVPKTFNALESYAMEGHTYHPSYKSRLGFTLEENLKYGPDFQPTMHLTWIAVPKHHVQQTISQSIVPEQLLKQQLGQETMNRFTDTLRQHVENVSDYVWLPVHPWQFDHMIANHFAEAWLNDDIIFLGKSHEAYVPQQSIRTLSPVETDKYYIKVPLNITNTSTKRVLAPHTIENAANITDWLKHIQAHDSYLRDQLRTVFLGEVLGMSYNQRHLTEDKRTATYGALGVIWRENIYHYLEAGEEAIPFHALYSKDTVERPVIDGWIQRYGSDNWMRQFINVAVRPLIHMLYTHGIALESHAQNMMLIHEEGWPIRVAIKDFHDGVRFNRALLSDIAKNPQLQATPEAHQRINRNSFIETDDVQLVRDFVLDAFFFINIAQQILFMDEVYNLSESDQWHMVYECIQDYLRAHPDLPLQQHFDLFERTIQVEKLTTRRLREDNELHIHHVTNPLGVIHHDGIIT
ncbi:staphyloferrin B biosynthesis protein SbnF [Staphylococcus hyicus]|uniref:staphyloferrin B biosynthesis protein SbnF n=1 Tax=Staphylococcus hyicus TaxID=1284 RepID=UPI00208F06B2|nr:staphyloferrin B biosynthesis protein SbnF [Staphylococcus hyicus]MCO4331881.1 staphyloferrin B biosynthesis protein SbnF [Staphylococcus hyicus]MCO4332904.1 staphyloferrin B biosynthesis protein SbnF [Staphylococcus hyicus]